MTVSIRKIVETGRGLVEKVWYVCDWRFRGRFGTTQKCESADAAREAAVVQPRA